MTSFFYRDSKNQMPPLTQSFFTLWVIFFIATNAHAAQVDIDFSNGLPENAQQSHESIHIQGYEFTSLTDSELIIELIDPLGDGSSGYGLRTLGLSAIIKRSDDQLFSLEHIQIQTPHQLTGATTELALSAYNADGTEIAAPIILSAGQLWSSLDIHQQASLRNVAKLKISGDSFDHISAFGFSSLATPISQVPLPATAWFLLSALLAGMATQRKKTSLNR